METMMPWSAAARASTDDICAAIHSHPFIKALADGTLAREKYMHYLRQDRLYLRQYARVLAHIASRIGRRDYAESFLAFAMDGIKVEESLHTHYLGAESTQECEMSPACALYTATLLSQGYEPVEVEAAAVLPCFTVYREVGVAIYALAKQYPGNPYMAWIDTYADEAFRKSTVRATEICNALAREASEDTRRKMSAGFRQCTRREWLFWESAWRMENWEI